MPGAASVQHLSVAMSALCYGQRQQQQQLLLRQQQRAEKLEESGYISSDSDLDRLDYTGGGGSGGGGPGDVDNGQCCGSLSDDPLTSSPSIGGLMMPVGDMILCPRR